jgi:branched-subunit amino acid transport protein
VSSSWIVVLGTCAAVYAFKASGPVLLGGRELPAFVHRLATLLPAALLAALVGVATLADGTSLTVDPRAAGVAAAAVALWRRAGFLVTVLVAAAATALARALLG